MFTLSFVIKNSIYPKTTGNPSNFTRKSARLPAPFAIFARSGCTVIIFGYKFSQLPGFHYLCRKQDAPRKTGNKFPFSPGFHYLCRWIEGNWAIFACKLARLLSPFTIFAEVNEEFAPQIERLTGISIDAAHRYGRPMGPQPAESVLVCYGGDGTLLDGIHRLGGAEIPVIGINSGHLGFLTSVPRNGCIGDVFELIAAGKLECQPRSMLEVTGDFGDGISTRYAVNEVVIQRQGAGMISVETYVNDQMVATYHGDGLIVSTPTGSTAYSLSVGGPVVAPQCACLVLSPVAPHNLTMRPIVIPSSSDVRLKVHARHAEISIATDNETCPIPEGAEFRVRLASRRFFLAVPHNISFYDTLRKKMMWGVDIRS